MEYTWYPLYYRSHISSVGTPIKWTIPIQDTIPTTRHQVLYHWVFTMNRGLASIQTAAYEDPLHYMIIQNVMKNEYAHI